MFKIFWNKFLTYKIFFKFSRFYFLSAKELSFQHFFRRVWVCFCLCPLITDVKSNYSTPKDICTERTHGVFSLIQWAGHMIRVEGGPPSIRSSLTLPTTHMNCGGAFLLDVFWRTTQQLSRAFKTFLLFN